MLPKSHLFEIAFDLITPDTRQPAPIDLVWDFIQEWLPKRVPDYYRPGNIDSREHVVKRPGGVTLRQAEYQSSDGALRWVELQHPDDHGAADWQTRISVATDGDRTALSCHLSHGDNTSTQWGCPKFLVDLVRSNRLLAMDQVNRLDADACVLQEKDLPELVEVLTDPRRERALILVAPNLLGVRSVDPDRLQRILLGSAVVATWTHPSLSYTLTERLGAKQLSCFDGGVRVYYPGFDLESDPREHPLIPRWKVGPYLAYELRDGVRAKTASDKTIDALFTTLESAWLEEEEISRAASRKAVRANAETNYEAEWLKIAEELETEQAAHAQARAEVASLRSLLDEIRVKQDKESLAHPSPRNLLEVLAAIEEEHPNLIVFHGGARRSAKNSASFPSDRVQGVYEMLRLMALTINECFVENNPTSAAVIHSLKNAGISCSDESDTDYNNKKRRRLMTIDIEGERIQTRFHIKKFESNSPNSCFRLYFHLDYKSRKLHVSFMGTKSEMD